ncbi:MAG: tetratricopeptide repeat protein [Leptothrix sp. (in: b-proteobacteria)]
MRRDPSTHLAPRALHLPLAPLAVLACLACVAPLAQAQLIDDVEVHREGADAVVRVHFTSDVRYTRSVSSRNGELTQAYYLLTDPASITSPLVSGERRVNAGDGLPQVTFTDESVGASSTERKLVIRVNPPTTMRVRAGRNNRSIEVVLVGLGAKVKPAVPVGKLPLAQPGQRFVVVLSSSTDPTQPLQAPVPGSLQDYSVGTSQRVVDGATLYEYHLGPFANRVEADRALDLLRKRFPKARVLALADGDAAPGAAAAAAPVAPPAASVEVQQAGADLLVSARAAMAERNTEGAIEALNRLLDLPPNPASREAQELIGTLRLKMGDTDRARREFELFLKLYPTGVDSQRVAAQLARLGAAPVEVAPPVAQAVVPSTVTTNGSIGVFYYGGKSKVRSEEFRDSPISGLPELVQNPELAGTDQRLAIGNVDLNYRNRSAEQDTRLVFRDTYQADLMPGKPERNRLSALYVDQRSLVNGTSVRLGRQSPNGGGVLGRFDGALLGYTFAPKWKVNVVAGRPTDKLAQSKRFFYGTSIDADALTERIGGSVHLIEQKIDGQTDRRGVGTDLRYFDGGAFSSANLDYDVKLRALNVAALQGSWQQIDANGNSGTTVNYSIERRALPVVMLGNALFFQSANGTLMPVRISDVLATTSIETLRDNVRATTAYSKQASLGVTTPINDHWQVGSDVRLISIGAIAPVADILPFGQPATGNIVSLGGQLIGSNLYSARDTHVFNVSHQRAPTFQGQLLMYNNLSALNEFWQFEPSMQVYRQRSTDGLRIVRWKPGLRVTRRVAQSWVLESALDYEVTRQTGLTRNEKTKRTFYYLGGRYDF